MLTIYKTYDTNIEDLGPIEFLYQSICFTKIIERVKCFSCYTQTIFDLENREDIVTGFDNKNFF